MFPLGSFFRPNWLRPRLHGGNTPRCLRVVHTLVLWKVLCRVKLTNFVHAPSTILVCVPSSLRQLFSLMAILKLRQERHVYA